MTIGNQGIETLGQPPDQYDPQYFKDMVGILNRILRRLNSQSQNSSTTTGASTTPTPVVTTPPPQQVTIIETINQNPTGLLYGDHGVPGDFLGQNGDFYLNLDTGDLYGPKFTAWLGSPLTTVGISGSDGIGATITIGTVTTGPPGTAASVVNSGTANNAVLDFVIPQGAQGAIGPQGPAGGTSTTPPSPPGGLAAVASSTTQINLSWDASTTSGVTYKVFASTNSGFTPGDSSVIANNLSATSYSATSLAASTYYYFYVQANSSLDGDSALSNQAVAQTQTPAPPPPPPPPPQAEIHLESTWTGSNQGGYYTFYVVWSAATPLTQLYYKYPTVPAVQSGYGGISGKVDITSWYNTAHNSYHGEVTLTLIDVPSGSTIGGPISI